MMTGLPEVPDTFTTMEPPLITKAPPLKVVVALPPGVRIV